MADSNRRDLAVESSISMRRAAWCGIVFALVVLIAFLNLMPPIHVNYRVRSQIVVSQSRLEQLRERAIADREAIRRGDFKRIQLMSVHVLDLADQPVTVRSQATDKKVILVEVNSLWDNLCSSESHFKWLQSISQIEATPIADSAAAQAARFARWELEVARHYKVHHEFLADEMLDSENSVASESRRTFDLASYSKPSDSIGGNQDTPAKLASLAPPSSKLAIWQRNGASRPAANFDVAKQLSEQLELAERHVQQTELAQQIQMERLSGTLQAAGVPEISPRSSSIPFWMAASFLVLGLSAGSSAGWLQNRCQSSEAYDATCVARRLAMDDVPIACSLELPSDEAEGTDWMEAASRHASKASRRTGRRLTQLSEWALTFWAILIVGRFLLDSIWRDVLFNSPLAALGRLMSGMP